MADVDLAIRGGTVVDGTGAPGRRADVGIAGGRVVAVDDVVRGRDELDATGRLVTPGFVDVHTHYDGQVLWDPALSPSCFQGVTSVVTGNCGYTIAPARPEGRDLLLRTLEKVEDMRLATMQAGIEWDFETFGDYLDAIERRRPLLNVGGYVGHTAVRVYVLGAEAVEREATPDEVDEMRAVVAAALRAGALGFSTSRAGFIAGADGKPIPSIAAGRDEVEALLRVPAEVGRGIVHVAPGEDLDWLYGLDVGRPLTWSSLLSYRAGTTDRASYRDKLARHAAARAGGADVWAQVTCRPITQLVTMLDPTPLSRVPAFAEVFALPPERRHEPYASDAWRRRAEADLASSSVPVRWEAYVVEETDVHAGLRGRSIRSIADERGCSPLDALCDLALGEGLRTRFGITFANDEPDAIAELLTGEGCVLGLSDAGAHVSQICDAVLPLDFLAGWVRDRQVLPLEAGIRKLTSELADLLQLDRGRLEPGRPADVLVLALDELDPGPVRRVHDMPAGGERLVADQPGGLDAVLVNGVPIRRDGQQVELDARPGQVLRSVGPS